VLFDGLAQAIGDRAEKRAAAGRGPTQELDIAQ